MRRASPRLLADQLDFWLVGLLALAALAAVAAGAAPLVRALLAVPLVLLLPGYALVHAVFPTLEMPAVERLLLAVGASTGLTILVGLLLAASGPLDQLRWTSALSGLTLIALVIAWVARIRRRTTGPRPGFATMPRLGALMVLVAALIALDVIAGTRLFAARHEAPPPVQLWMVPVAEAPTEALLGVRAGADGGDFRIVISVDEQSVHEFDIELEPQATWETFISFPADLRERPIVARLYEGTSQTESRYVTLQPETDGG